MPTEDELLRVWQAFTNVAHRFFAAGPAGARLGGPGWFAALANEPSGELNVCGLTPEATVTSAGVLHSSIAPDLPLIVFVSEHAGPEAGALLEANGFETVTVPEPLMHTRQPPTPVDTALRIAPAADAADVAAGIALTSEANTVDAELLERSILHAARSGAAQMWLAWDGGEPISVVWIVRHENVLGVMEMMTPARHQRRGAGRALLTHALAAEWRDDTEFTVLLSTPAGRRLYESIGFKATDEVMTRYRGLDDAVLAAIGQPG
jgi:ribosomal protein S18 acetylase RimI-like enzyme